MLSDSSATDPDDGHDKRLRTRRNAEGDKADLDGADALRTGLQRAVHYVSAVVTMRAKCLQQKTLQTRRVFMRIRMSTTVLVLLFSVRMPIDRVVLVARAHHRRSRMAGMRPVSVEIARS